MSEKTRIVLAGCGGICGAWLKPLSRRADVEVVGLIDLNEESARKRAGEFGLAGAATGTSLAAMLDRLKPDAVFDCTTPESHVGVALEAISRGCHVLGEKPMADTMPNARRMLDAARGSSRTCAVIQNRRFLAGIRRLRAFIESGAIGQVTTIHSRFLIGAHFGGFREKMEHPLILDMAIHTFDMARFISRADAAKVLCHSWNPPGSWYGHHASAVAVFEMTGGIVYAYEGSWCSEGLNTTWEGDWQIIGTKGSASWNGGDVFRAQRVGKREGLIASFEDIDVPPAESLQMKGHAGVIDDFLRSLRENRLPETAYEDNIKSLAMVHAAIESSSRGCRVEVA